MIDQNYTKGGATTTNGTLRKAYDNNARKDSPIRTGQHGHNPASAAHPSRRPPLAGPQDED
ncbi:hypothetical protein CVM73_30610 [Bradyrhizobium forestalis]|uniref:Uncharacterized protein n=1 Tax=Bradyrhizobium forestalis TaxID=1419263 RepID=A0A2M8R190_9BRAD|nr:hypothetical protein CVM73_30610 [Bradyrhizobium forestalis]